MNDNEVNAINPSENVNNKSNTFNLVIGIATLLIALLGATFAYFSATARSAENDVTVKSAYVSISYDGGTEIKASNLIPSSLRVTLSKYMKDVQPHNPDEGDIITDYDVYNSTDSGMSDRKCVDILGKEVCYIYQFSIKSDGPEGGVTPILASIKVNNNQFDNLSYLLYEVTPREENGVILQDRFGADIIDKYTLVSDFDNVDQNEDGAGLEKTKFATFEKPYPIINDEGINEETVYPMACLFGYSKEEEKMALREDNSDRCVLKTITNNEKHTYQLLIWLEETGEVQEEQGFTFEGTVNIEVSGGQDVSEYGDGKITGVAD